MAKIYGNRRGSTIRNHNRIHELFNDMRKEYGDVFSHLSKTFIYKEIAKKTLLHEKTVANVLNLTEYKKGSQ